MIQLSLFDAPPPPLSPDGADDFAQKASWPIVAGFLAHFKSPVTAEELVAFAERLGTKYSSSRIRGALAPSEMEGMGYVVCHKDAARTKRNRLCATYELTQSGWEVLLD
jgi:hypothetical protein